MSVAVAVVRAYLELNGYFVLSELPVRVVQRHLAVDITHVDVIAVRFPHPRVRAGRDAHPLDLYLRLDADIEVEEDGVDVIIGEVKDGRAELNAGLRRTDTVAFAIRRLGCRPERDVSDAADRDGETHLTMAPGLPCRVRLVAFGSSVAAAHGGGVRVISLEHCIQFSERRMKAAWYLVGGLHFEDPMLRPLRSLPEAQRATVSSTKTHSV